MSSPSIPATQPNNDSPITGRRPAAHGAYQIGLAYGRQVYRFRWLVLALWVGGLLVGVPFASKLSSVLQSGGYTYDGSQAAQANQTLINKLHWPPSQALVVFQSSTTPVTDSHYQQEVGNFMDRAKTFGDVTGVSSGGVGRDGKTTYVLVDFSQNASVMQQSMANFRSLLPVSGPARAYLSGDPETYLEYNTITQQDIEHSEAVTLPVALVVLVIVFGTLVAALMPLLLAVVAVPVALALLYAVAVHSWTSIFVLNVATVVGLGISIDYSLFMVRRFRDELANGRHVRDAVAWTVATTGEAILFSGLAVIVGFSGLFLIGIPFMSSFGLGGALTVASAVLAALTLMPAILAILGPRINALRVPFFRRTSHVARPVGPNENGEVGQDSTSSGFWHRWALAVMRRPILVLVGCAALLLLLGWPIFSMRVGTYGSVSLPAQAEAQQGYTILSNQFPASAANPIYVVVQTQDGSSFLTTQHLAELDGLSQWLASQAHVTSMTSLTQLPPEAGGTALSETQLVALYTSGAYTKSEPLANWVKAITAGDTTVITLTSNTKLDSSQGTGLVDTLRAGSQREAPGFRVQIGGTQALSLDFTRHLYSNFPRTILFILVTTYLLLLLMFRSLLLPLKAVLVNVLSLAASYGVLVFVFQWGHFSGLLNFTSTGFLDSTMPILIFCVLFGLSMDYEVFLLSRIREEWLRTHNNRYAVARGLEKTGGVITNAALLFAIVTGAFTFTSLVTMKELGLGMTVAVLVDATIIRTLLVPAAMRLLGRWNWWLPGHNLPVEQV
ncbi:MAG: MMPL family transporter [Ktedonobacterales bacterium]